MTMSSNNHIKIIVSYQKDGVKGHNGAFPTLYDVKNRFYDFGINEDNVLKLEKNGEILKKEEIIQFFNELIATRKPMNLSVVGTRTSQKKEKQQLTGLQKIIRSAGLDEDEWEVTKNSLTKVQLAHISTGELKEIAV